MSRPPSVATQLRHAMRDIKSLRRSLDIQCGEVERFRGRATKAEQEAAAWKERFDKLLNRPFLLESHGPSGPIFPAMDGTCFACGEKHVSFACPKLTPTSSVPPTGVNDGT